MTILLSAIMLLTGLALGLMLGTTTMKDACTRCPIEHERGEAYKKQCELMLEDLKRVQAELQALSLGARALQVGRQP